MVSIGALRTLYIEVGARVGRAVAGLKAVDKAGDQAAQSLENVDRQADATARRAQRLRSGLAVLGTATVGLGAAMYAVAKQGARIDQQFSVIQATTGATTGQMDAMRDEVQRLGADLPVTMQDSAAALKQLSFAGYSAEESIAAVGGVAELASATTLSVSDAATITANSLNQFGQEADNAGAVADTIAGTFASSSVTTEQLAQTLEYAGAAASTAGQTLTQTAAAAGIMGDNGIKGSKAGTALAQSLSRLADPSNEAQSALQEVGLSASDFTDEQGNFKSMAQIAALLQKNLSGLSNQQRLSVLTRVFGQRGARGMAALASNAGALQQRVEQISASEITGAMDALSDLDNSALQQRNQELAQLASQQGLSTSASVQLSGDMDQGAILRQFQGVSDTLNKQQLSAQIQTALNVGETPAQELAVDVKGGASIQELTQSLNEAQDAGGLAEAQMRTVAGQVEYLTGSIESFAYTAYGAFKPAIQAGLGVLVTFVDLLNANETTAKVFGTALLGLGVAAGAATVALGAMYAELVITETLTADAATGTYAYTASQYALSGASRAAAAAQFLMTASTSELIAAVTGSTAVQYASAASSLTLSGALGVVSTSFVTATGAAYAFLTALGPIGWGVIAVSALVAAAAFLDLGGAMDVAGDAVSFILSPFTALYGLLAPAGQWILDLASGFYDVGAAIGSLGLRTALAPFALLIDLAMDGYHALVQLVSGPVSAAESKFNAASRGVHQFLDPIVSLPATLHSVADSINAIDPKAFLASLPGRIASIPDQVSLPDLGWPDLSFPDLHWPDLSLPDISAPVLSIPEIRLADFITPFGVPGILANVFDLDQYVPKISLRDFVLTAPLVGTFVRLFDLQRYIPDVSLQDAIGSLDAGLSIPGRFDIPSLDGLSLPTVNLDTIVSGTLPTVDLNTIVSGTLPTVDLDTVVRGAVAPLPTIDLSTVTAGVLPRVDLSEVVTGALPDVPTIDLSTVIPDVATLDRSLPSLSETFTLGANLSIQGAARLEAMRAHAAGVADELGVAGRAITPLLAGLNVGSDLLQSAAIAARGLAQGDLSALAPAGDRAVDAFMGFETVRTLVEAVMGPIKAVSGGLGTIRAGLSSLSLPSLDVGEFVSGLEWTDFVPTLALTEFVTGVDVSEYVAGFDWRDLVPRLEWTDFVPGVALVEYVTGVDISQYVSGFNWREFVADLEWSDFVPSLVLPEYLTGVDISQYVSGFNWREFVADLEWSDFVPGLALFEYVSGVDVSEYVSEFDWRDLVPQLEWIDFIPGISLSEYVTGTDVSASVSGFDWVSFISNLEWGDFVTDLNISEFVSGFNWDSFVADLEWTDFIPGLALTEYVTGIDVSEQVAGIDWRDVVTTLEWTDFVPGLALTEYVSGVDVSEYVAGIDWQQFVRTLEWTDFVPGLALTEYVSGVDVSEYVAGIDWREFIPHVTWDGFIPHVDLGDYVSGIGSELAPPDTSGFSLPDFGDPFAALDPTPATVGAQQAGALGASLAALDGHEPNAQVTVETGDATAALQTVSSMLSLVTDPLETVYEFAVEADDSMDVLETITAPADRLIDILSDDYEFNLEAQDAADAFDTVRDRAEDALSLPDLITPVSLLDHVTPANRHIVATAAIAPALNLYDYITPDDGTLSLDLDLMPNLPDDPLGALGSMLDTPPVISPVVDTIDVATGAAAGVVSWYDSLPFVAKSAIKIGLSFIPTVGPAIAAFMTVRDAIGLTQSVLGEMRTQGVDTLPEAFDFAGRAINRGIHSNLIDPLGSAKEAFFDAVPDVSLPSIALPSLPDVEFDIGVDLDPAIDWFTTNFPRTTEAIRYRIASLNDALAVINDAIPEIHWRDYIPHIDLSQYIPTIRWDEWIPDINWQTLIGSLPWPVLIPALPFAAFIDWMGWADVIPALDWHEYVPVIRWDEWLPTIRWDDWIPDIRWDDWIPAIDLAQYVPVIRWSEWIPTIHWRDFVPQIDIPLPSANEIYAGLADIGSGIGDALLTGADVTLATLITPERMLPDVASWWFNKGKEIIRTLANGITSSPDILKNALTSTLRGLLPFLPSSDAQRGPLSSLTSRGRGLVSAIASGIRSGDGLMQTAIDTVFGGIDMPSLPDVSLPSLSGSLDMPTVPDLSSLSAPSMPDLPSIPDMPPVPDLPSIPDMPPVPDVPQIPDMPTVPDLSSLSAPSMPDLPSIPDMPPVPDLPSIPDMPPVPDVPQIPDMPPVPDLPQIPDMPTVPDLPSMPDLSPMPNLRSVSLPDIPDVPDVPDLPNLSNLSTPDLPSIPDVPGLGDLGSMGLDALGFGGMATPTMTAGSQPRSTPVAGRSNPSADSIGNAVARYMHALGLGGDAAVQPTSGGPQTLHIDARNQNTITSTVQEDRIMQAIDQNTLGRQDVLKILAEALTNPRAGPKPGGPL